jgi:MFS transporter, DHA2 family, multidrug resistance protein
MTTAAEAGAAPSQGRGINRAMITVSVMLATIMQVLDTTIANVALPSMQGSLNAAQDTITWVLTSYIVALAIATPMTGWMAARLGRKRLFLIVTAGFTVASMLCGLATSLGEMVAYRILQGVFGAALVPMSQAVLLDINPKERHGQAMAIWGAGIMVAPIIGPTLGGWLTDGFDWRWVFYINLPVGILAFAGILAYLPETEIKARPFDFLGFAMLGLAIGSAQMILDRGEQLDWFASREIWIELAVMISGFWVFLVHVWKRRDPFLDLAIFRDRNLVTGLIFIFVIGIILLATAALLPPMLQGLMGYPVMTTGLVLAPRGIGTMVSMLLVGRLVRVVDPRLLVLAGLLLTIWSLWMMTGFSLEMDTDLLVVSGVVQGLGLGLVFVPLSAMAFATLDGRFRNDATALFSLMRNLGSSFGVSLVVTMLAQNTQINHAELAARISPFNPLLDGLALPGDPAAGGQALAMLEAMVSRQAAMIAYVDDFMLMMFVTMLAVPMLLMLRSPQSPRR